MTLAEMAEELGLSARTVSSVVNGKAKERRISKATAERVRQYLDLKGFVPSLNATRMRKSPDGLIGILHSGGLAGHQAKAFEMLLDRLDGTADRPMEVRLVRQDRFPEGLRDMVARGVSKVVWIQRGHPERELLGRDDITGFLGRVQLIIQNFLFSRSRNEHGLTSRGVHLVGVDRQKGYEVLASRIAALGHRCVLLPQLDSYGFATRFMVGGMRAVGIRLASCPGFVSKGDLALDAEALVEPVMRSMQQDGATVVCMGSDDSAAHLMGALLRRGIRVPGDISVTGFEGLEFGASLVPALTTLSMPVAAMVERVCNIVAGEAKRHRHCFDLELVERDSLGPAPRRLSRSGRTRASSRSGKRHTGSERAGNE